MLSEHRWPKPDTQSMNRFYGSVGTSQTKFTLPYPLVLSWNRKTTIKRITCHKKVAPSMAVAMEDILSFYGKQGIEELQLNNWGGCLNVRRTRGGRTYSKHAWGAANDWFPEANGLHTPFEHSAFSDPVYAYFLNAWIKEGWDVLGLSWGKDSMHIQATDNELELLPIVI